MVMKLGSRPGLRLTGRRVRLEPLRLTHVDALYSIATHPDVAGRWPLFRKEIERSEFEEYIWSISDLQFVIRQRRSDQVIGLVQGIGEDARDRTIGLGLVIEPSLWLRGWPLEGAVLFIDLLFDVYGYRKVYFHLPQHAADRVTGALGHWLTKEATYSNHFQVGDSYQDLHVYALHQDDWDGSIAKLVQADRTGMMGKGGT